MIWCMAQVLCFIWYLGKGELRRHPKLMQPNTTPSQTRPTENDEAETSSG